MRKPLTLEQRQRASKCAKEWRLKNPERFKATQRRSVAKHKYKRRAETREWERTHPVHKRGYGLKRRYGITIQDYEVMKVGQGSLCAICLVAPSVLVVDHNHRTNTVRGLLCHSCNLGIGSLKESPLILESAATYLRRGEVHGS